MSKSRARKGAYLIRDLRERRDSCGIYHLAFAPIPKSMTAAERKKLERHQEKRFLAWWDSWIAPLITEVEDRLVKPARRGGK